MRKLMRKRGHTNVKSFEEIVEWNNIEPRVVKGIARIPIWGGSAPGKCREFPPLALRENEWDAIGVRMGWIPDVQLLLACKHAVALITGGSRYPDHLLEETDTLKKLDDAISTAERIIAIYEDDRTFMKGGPQ